MEYKKTLKDRISISGIGLHSGNRVTLTILPSYEDTGIVFIRKDIPNSMPIQATVSSVVDTRFATTIGKARAVVSTIEHLMAALAGCGVDNALIEVDGPEVPVFDGSAAPFVALIQETGTVNTDFPKQWIRIIRKISVKDGDKSVTLQPADCLKVNFQIRFDHPLIRSQKFTGKITEKTFKKRLAIARTFGFLRDVELLKQNGLAQGGSMDNAIVLDDKEILNSEGLRFSDEFVRHKALDLIGDLYLLGAPLKAEITAFKSGHTLHYKLARKMIENPHCWVIEESGATRQRSVAAAAICIGNRQHQDIPLAAVAAGI